MRVVSGFEKVGTAEAQTNTDIIPYIGFPTITILK